MRRYVIGLLLPLLAACAGKNTVAGDEKTKAEQLQESVPDWCAKACQKIDACAKEKPCDCGGTTDVCDCRGGAGDDCPSSCAKAMGEFMNKGETCASAGLHFQSCIDAASCDALYKEGTCGPANDAEKGCFPADYGATPSDSGSSSSAGSTDSSGPSSGGAYGAGGSSGFAYGGTSMAGGSPAEGGAPASDVVSCQEGFSSGPAPGNTTNEICEGGGLGCSDGNEYRYLCARTSDGRSACSCFVNDNVTGAFDPNGVCPTSDAINAGCGWSLIAF